jgi:predicted lysophospholipase L1 biosynthesis ABC-type transport system permease subunit
VVGTGGIGRDHCALLALNWAAVAMVGIGLGPILGPAIHQLASRSMSSSSPMPAAMVLTACSTLLAAAVSTDGSALDQPAT